MNPNLQPLSGSIGTIIVAVGFLGAIITFIIKCRLDLLMARKTKTEIKKLEIDISNAKSTMAVSPNSDSGYNTPVNQAKKRKQVGDRTVTILTIVFICYNYAIFFWQMFSSGNLTRAGLGMMILSAGSVVFLSLNWILSLCITTMMKVHKSILETIVHSTEVLGSMMTHATTTSTEIIAREMGATNEILRNKKSIENAVHNISNALSLTPDKPSEQRSAQTEQPAATPAG